MSAPRHLWETGKMRTLHWILLWALLPACQTDDTAVIGPRTDPMVDAMVIPDQGVDGAPVQVPRIELTPNRGFVFPPLEVGEETERALTIHNRGEADLQLSMFHGEFSAEFILTWGFGVDPAQAGRAGIQGENNAFPPLVTVPVGDALTMVLNYRPGTNASPRGRFVMNTNAPDFPLLELPIRGRDAIGALRASPSPVDFGRVSENATQVQLVTIENVGQVTVFFGDVTVSGDPRFLGQFGDIPIADAGEALEDPDEDGTRGLAPGASFPIAIQYTAAATTPAMATLAIANDGIVSPLNVALVANGENGCAQVRPRSLDFGPALVDRDNPLPLTIESCGNGSLVIERIDVVEGAEVFSVDTSALPLTLPPANLRVDPPRFPAREFPVIFRPTETGEFSGRLSIVTNDPASSAVPIPLAGEGAETACPTPRAVTDDFQSTALDIVVLDGGPSTDLDGEGGRPVSYTWTLVDAPTGSMSRVVESISQPTRPALGGPDDDVSTPTARLFIDTVGRYVVELSVTDADGQVAPSETCPREPARVVIDAYPTRGLHVELRWENGDPIEGDGGRTDLDLHLLHPDAQEWFDRELDCYFANPAPSWDAVGGQDDPRLTIQSTDQGPEVLTAGTLSGAHEAPFRLGVHFYRVEHRGQAYLRAYFQDELVHEASRDYAPVSTLWHTLDVSVRGRIDIQPRDEDTVVVPR